MTDEFAAAADEVFDALFREDLAALVSPFDSRSRLRDAVVACARKVAARLAKTGVGPRDRHLVIAACFTWGRSHARVARNTGHAARKAQRYQRFVDVPIRYLVRTDRVVPDDQRAFSLLAHSLRVRDGMTGAGEPELVLNMVVPAIVAALGEDTEPGTAMEVLDRGAELAAAYRVSGKRVDLPVVGNADFLVRVAAYRMAIQERRHRPADDLDHVVRELVDVMRRAMTRPAGNWIRRGADEPDVATALNQYVGYLSDKSVREAVTAVHSVLNYRLGLGEPPVDIAVGEPDTLTAPSADGTERHSEVENLVRRLVAALLRAAGPEIREPLLHWLAGKRAPDDARDLPALLRQLRRAVTELDHPRDPAVTRLPELGRDQFEALVTRIAATVDPGGLTDDHRHDARHVTLAALSPLWTNRHPAVQLVTAHLRALLSSRPSASVKAKVVAAHGVRAPFQFVQRKCQALPDRCCPQPMPRSGPREPAPHEQVCPHRPWGEVGYVENYWSLGRAAGCSADAARKQLDHYQGPWPELLAD